MYEKIKNTLGGENDTHTKGIKQFHICRMPMIGKTHFLYYVLAQLLVDYPELPGIATLGVLPGASESNDMEFFNELNCVQTTTSTGDEKKVTTTLKIAEVTHNRPPSDNKEIKNRFKDYIFLIDNAKREYVYSVMNMCIVFASLKLETYAVLNNVKTNTKTYWILVWSPEEIAQFQHLLPEALPVGENNDTAYLLHHF